MSFARPFLLLLLAVLPIWWWLRSRRHAAARFSEIAPIAAAATARRWVGEIPAGLRCLAVAAWVVAAAGPEIATAAGRMANEGIAIVLAIDVSSSMLAEDFAPHNRMDVAKQQSEAFVNGRRSDRIGLVTFAGEALTRVPVTADYAVLQQAIRDIRIGELEDGTAIGTAIATAANRLRRAQEKSKVILLLTDGENNRGRVDPRTAAAAAAKLGLKIYTIGVGTEGEARLPIGRGPEGQLRYQTMPVRIDEALLRDVAQSTGGRYFRATDSEALSRIFQQIDALEKTAVQVTRYSSGEESYLVPLIIGLAALGLELAIGATAVVRVP